jgi:ssDNA-binding Zn-finger/Zn-ribbon topoisomerase 1
MTAKEVPWRPVTADATKPQCPMTLDDRARHGEMRLLEGRLGYFWGCVRYPDCTFTIDAVKWERDEAERLGYGNDDEMVRWDR